MGASSSSCNVSTNGKFIKIGEEFIGEDEKTYTALDICQIRFLQPKVIDRIIVQLRIEVKAGRLLWTILRSFEDFRQLKMTLNIPGDNEVSFPKTDQRFFPDNEEILQIPAKLSKWLLVVSRNGVIESPMITFLGIMDNEISETSARQIDLGTFIRTCETGDILLFQTPGFIPSSIRKITNGKYDHVGVIIVKVFDGGGREVCFLEASGDRWGVNNHNLRTRLQEWWLADARICHRRLRCARDERFRDRTNDFIAKVQGLKYGWSIKSLVLNTKDQQTGDKSKFFCSELVTAFYKHVGLIQSSAKSHNYMPGDFAEKQAGSRLNLVDAVLEHEVMVTKWPRQTKIRRSNIHERKRSRSIGDLAPNCIRALPQTGSRKDRTRRKRSNSVGH